MQAADIVPVDPGAGGIGRIGEEHDPGPLVHLREKQVHVDPAVGLRGETDDSLGRADGDAIGEEAVLPLDRIVARLQIGLAQKVEDLVRTGCKDEAILLQLEPVRHGLAQDRAVPIGIEVQLVRGGQIGGPGQRRAAQGVLVGG